MDKHEKYREMMAQAKKNLEEATEFANSRRWTAADVFSQASCNDNIRPQKRASDAKRDRETPHVVIVRKKKREWQHPDINCA
jgi:hypothetical protein